MRNIILILFVMGAYLSLAWATQERPVFDPKTKSSIKAILEKINESEEVNKINKDELFNADQAGLRENSPAESSPEKSELISNEGSGGLNTTAK